MFKNMFLRFTLGYQMSFTTLLFPNVFHACVFFKKYYIGEVEIDLSKLGCMARRNKLIQAMVLSK